MSNNGQQNLSQQQFLDIAIQYHNAGELNKAKSIYQQVLKNNPENPHAFHLLGVIAHQVGQLDDAKKLILKCLSINPDMDEAHNNLANVFEALGQHEEAITHFRRSIEIKPGVAEVHFNLGNTFRGLGQLDDALIHYHKATELNPQYAEVHRQIASIKKHTVHDNDIKVMETLFTNPKTTDFQKMHLAFGLGKAFEDLQQYEKAFQFIEQGNQIKHENFKTPISNWDNQISRIKKSFNRTLFDRFQDAGSKDETPIFILGMPRSGTSLVEQILASHPEVFGAGEVHTLNKSIGQAFNISNLLEDVQQTTNNVLEQLGNNYVTNMREKNSVAKCITDKMPGNFKFIGMIQLMLPKAKIIHCRRNPMDNCLSLFKNYFSKGHVYAYDQIEIAEYYLRYQRLMDHWYKVLPDSIYTVQYEDLIADQEAQTQKLLEYCGLKWDDACLTFYQTKRTVKTVSAAQVRNPIYSDSVESWKRYEKQLEPLRKTLQEI